MDKKSNTGNWNTGDRNAGDWNTGNWNTGDGNTGGGNAGYRNTGNWNTGNWNTGDRNAGYRNTGNWNTGDRNTGYCNSVTPEDCLIFNKPAKISDWENAKKPRWMYVDLTEWIDAKDMSSKEKEAYPSYITTGGYLKCYSSLKHAYVDAWEKASDGDRELTKRLPNFDPDVFEEVFGFNPFKKATKTITIDGKNIEISEDSFNEFKKQFTEGNTND
ncbi:MAG: pentapeptide repeat-containing protein [Pseudomonadales bacterium]|nr:pentapeptide repeat-containing protein [Pseudomonadales bacterium]